MDEAKRKVKNEKEHYNEKKIWYDNIDLIKFLGILFVVLYHLTTVKFHILENASIGTYINYVIRSILSTCVPLFLFANGFLLINKKLNLKNHIMKTIKFILLTVIWGIITLMILMLIEDKWLTIQEFFIALFTWKEGWINHLWYMGALICVYFIFPLIKIAFDHNKKVFHYWVVICSLFVFGNVIMDMIATICGNRYIGSDFFDRFNLFNRDYGHALAYFSIGCFIGGNHTLIQKEIKKHPVINRAFLIMVIFVSTVLLGAWGIFYTKLKGEIWDVVWYGYNTIFTLINVLAIYQMSHYYKNNGGRIGNYIQLVSRNTLGIYFMHIIFQHVFNKLGIGLLPFAHNYVFNILYALFVITVCLIITLAMKKIKIVKKLVT